MFLALGYVVYPTSKTSVQSPLLSMLTPTWLSVASRIVCRALHERGAWTCWLTLCLFQSGRTSVNKPHTHNSPSPSCASCTVYREGGPQSCFITERLKGSMAAESPISPCIPSPSPHLTASASAEEQITRGCRLARNKKQDCQSGANPTWETLGLRRPKGCPVGSSRAEAPASRLAWLPASLSKPSSAATQA